MVEISDDGQSVVKKSTLVEEEKQAPEKKSPVKEKKVAKNPVV